MPLTREDLLWRVQMIHEIFTTLLGGPAWQGLGHESQQQLTTGVNKAFGQAMGFQHEYMSTVRAHGKGRHVVTQLRGDVTVGQPQDPFAKTIECKSVTAPDKGSVNAAIRKAIEQLAGQTGHMPRAEDVRVVDVVIDGNQNPWPMNGGSYDTRRLPVPLDTLIDYALLELEDMLLRSNAPGATEIRNWVDGQSMFGVQSLGPLRNMNGNFPRSSRLVAQGLLQPQLVRCVTIKIRYTPPYPLPPGNDPQEVHGVEEMLFQFYKSPTGLKLEVGKIKTFVVNLVHAMKGSRTHFV